MMHTNGKIFLRKTDGQTIIQKNGPGWTQGARVSFAGEKMNIKMNILCYNSYIEVDTGQLLINTRRILAGLGAGTQLIPVLKTDAYGLGLVPVARTLCTLPEIRTIAVAHVSEGLALREAGIDREILVMGGALPFQMEAAAETGLTLACAHLGFASAFACAAKHAGKRGKLHLKIDTGLHRIGTEPEELGALIDELRERDEHLEITGAFSHFSCVGNRALDEKEYQLFLDAVEVLESAGIRIPIRHMACSLASELYPEFHLDAVRCGRRLMMDRPGVTDGGIREIASFRSFITNLKPRKAGDYIGYGGTVRLDRDCLVATVGIGYGDGLNQALFSINGPVLAGGKRCRLLACCMDQCMIDVSGTDCSVGNEVTFFGYDREGNFLSSQDVAALVNGDEGCGLTSALSGRVKRIYL